jgi:hypothetical protein
MPNNYILLETIALTQSAASVTFDNLPTSGYTDLKIVFSTRDNNGQPQNGIFVSINGSTANFTNRYLLGSGSAASSGSIARFLGYSSGAGATANTFSNGELYFPNYRSSNNKSFSSDNVQETNASTAYMVMSAHLWSQTAAITSISLIADSASFVAGSTFSLYGIAALGTTPVLAPKATGGNRIENDGTYWIHTFLSSGVFTPQTGLTCDYLVVAGGGGSGAAGGGGGAGGYRAGSSFSVASVTNYPITVGAGGTGAFQAQGINGSDSVFSTITSTGGGGGGTDYINGSNGQNGGSGGGAQMNPALGETAGTGNTPSTSPAQGTNGGAGSTSGTGFGGGGGGGASAAGGAGSSTNGGAGGAGTSNSISGSSVAYAGGGGGGSFTGTAGTGGTGGGGAGTAGAPTSGNAGTANTGGGAGGSGGGAAGSSGANGGSGIVIIRYPIV